MKLVYCAPHSSVFPSRSANTINQMRMCEAFEALGHDVTLLVAGSRASSKEIFGYYGIEQEFDIYRLWAPRVRGMGTLYACKAYRTILEVDPDVVFGRSVKICALAAWKGIPTVFDSHAPVWEENCLFRLAYKRLIKSHGLRKVITNSAALKELYENACLAPACGITVAHNGSPECPLDELPGEWPGRDGVFQVGYVGHLYPGRGVDVITEAASRIPSIDFHVIGGMERDIEFWRGRVQLPNLFFHGHKKQSVVYRYRNACDVLLAPYQDKGVAMAGGRGDQSRYMNPIKLFEYMATRKPIIASDLPVLCEMLEHERNALLCPPEDVEAWCDAIEKLRSDDKLSDRLARNAHKDFVENYTWEARAKKVLACVEQKQP